MDKVSVIISFLYFAPHGSPLAKQAVHFIKPDCIMFSNQQNLKVSEPDIHQGRLHGGLIVSNLPAGRQVQPETYKKELVLR